ncbi:MAG: EamA family transporter [Euryarchaeota archaeon]|nr:EamA family transporter [Euryarchaeota archaeon]
MDVLIIILIGITFASLGQITWKWGMNIEGAITELNLDTLVSMALNPYVVLGVGMYGLSMLCWLVALSRKDLSYVYPFIALTFIIVLLASKFLFNEELPALRIVGTLIVILGILVIVQT